MMTLCGVMFSLVVQEVDVAALLKRADEQAGNFTDVKMITTMVVDDKGSTKTAKFETMQKGDKRFVRFLAPADAKGMTVLVEEGGSSFVYLPQFQKVRRVSGHQQNQGLMDSDFSNEDLGSVRFGVGYDAALVEDGDKVTKLKLTPQAGRDSAYDALLVSVEKDHLVYVDIEYQVGGKTVKRQTRSDIKMIREGFYMPCAITMQDLTRPHKTTLTMDKVVANSGLSDALFTKQALERQR